VPVNDLVDWLVAKAPELTPSQSEELAISLCATFEVHAKDSLRFLDQEDGYIRVYTESGDSWISISKISNVRHISIVEVTLSSGDVLHIDVTSQELLQFLSSLIPSTTFKERP
jgi:hypothetical protein